MALSPRLQALYDLCLPDLPFWDLCCDHGLLGLWALQSGRFREVIFNDAVAPLLAKLPAKIGAYPGRILCAKAEDIAEPLSGNVVIAGVGGEKIIKILTAHASRGTLQAHILALCPEKDAEWMMEQPIPGYQTFLRVQITHNQGQRWIVGLEPIQAINI